MLFVVFSCLYFKNSSFLKIEEIVIGNAVCIHPVLVSRKILNASKQPLVIGIKKDLPSAVAAGRKKGGI